jgi:hypothetical protein
MLQWRHSGLVNAVARMKDDGYKVKIEGLLSGKSTGKNSGTAVLPAAPLKDLE